MEYNKISGFRSSVTIPAANPGNSKRINWINSDQAAGTRIRYCSWSDPAQITSDNAAHSLGAGCVSNHIEVLTDGEGWNNGGGPTNDLVPLTTAASGGSPPNL